MRGRRGRPPGFDAAARRAQRQRLVALALRHELTVERIMATCDVGRQRASELKTITLATLKQRPLPLDVLTDIQLARATATAPVVARNLREEPRRAA